MQMSTVNYEINRQRMENLQSAHEMYKALLAGAQSDLELWEEKHLAELRKMEEINRKFEGMEKS